MIHITCRAEELWELRYEYFHHPHPRIQMKMAAVLRTVLAQHRHLVAAMLGGTETTVRTYGKAYRDGGIDALKQFEVRGSTSALDAHFDTLRAAFEQYIFGRPGLEYRHLFKLKWAFYTVMRLARFRH